MSRTPVGLSALLLTIVTVNYIDSTLSASDSVGVYVPGWIQTRNKNEPVYLDIDTVDLTNVTVIYYAFAWIKPGPSFELYDEFGNLE